ncbi:MAG TPA: 16S rRNA (uracil(1498)-N(3))-methyltransferase [Nitrospirota bacterium]|nr:16S rRNA (uracil(1498)-N(3))-methyltransferase [Nitrospirota bacterium]
MSRLPRFFIVPDQVSGPNITVSGEDVRHIGAVLRMKPGDELLLCDGKGTEYSVRIIQVNRSEIKTEIVNKTLREIAYPRITLGQGLPKSDKMDWIVQKATELGVATIAPLVTERTIVKVKDEEKRVSRWQKICREAAMQSSRPDIPQVHALVSFAEFLRTLNSEPRTLFLFPWEEGTKPIKDVLRGKDGFKYIVVLIGPEGGFSEAEAELATSKGFHPVSLGPNILRTETAAMAVLSMILYETNTKDHMTNST